MDPEDERALLRWLTRTELAQVLCLALLGLLLLAACLLLLDNNARLDELRLALVERNRQGARVVEMLEAMQARLER